MAIKFKLGNSTAESYELRANYDKQLTPAIRSAITVAEFHLKQTYISSAEQKRSSLRLMLELAKMHKLERLRFDRLFAAPSLPVLLEDLSANEIAEKIRALDVDFYEPQKPKKRVDFSHFVGMVRELTLVNSDPYCAAGYMGRLERLTIKNLRQRSNSELLVVHNAASLKHLDVTTKFDDEFLRLLDYIHLVKLDLDTLTVRYVYDYAGDVVAKYERITATERVGLADVQVARMRLATNSLARFADALRTSKLHRPEQQTARFAIEDLQIGLDGGMDPNRDPDLLARIVQVHRQQLKRLAIFTLHNMHHMPLIWQKIFDDAQNIPEIIVAEANGRDPMDQSVRPSDSIRLDSSSGRRRLNADIQSGRHHRLPSAAVIFFTYKAAGSTDELDAYVAEFVRSADVVKMTVNDANAVCLERIAAGVAGAYARDPHTTVFGQATYIRGPIREAEQPSPDLGSLFGLPAVQMIIFDVPTPEVAATVATWYQAKAGWQAAKMFDNERGTQSVVYAKSGVVYPSPEYDLSLGILEHGQHKRHL